MSVNYLRVLYFSYYQLIIIEINEHNFMHTELLCE